jgi:hypothetical protein
MSVNETTPNMALTTTATMISIDISHIALLNASIEVMREKLDGLHDSVNDFFLCVMAAIVFCKSLLINEYLFYIHFSNAMWFCIS